VVLVLGGQSILFNLLLLSRGGFELLGFKELGGNSVTFAVNAVLFTLRLLGSLVCVSVICVVALLILYLDKPSDMLWGFCGSLLFKFKP